MVARDESEREREREMKVNVHVSTVFRKTICKHHLSPGALGKSTLFQNEL